MHVHRFMGAEVGTMAPPGAVLDLGCGTGGFFEQLLSLPTPNTNASAQTPFRHLSAARVIRHDQPRCGGLRWTHDLHFSDL